MVLHKAITLQHTKIWSHGTDAQVSYEVVTTSCIVNLTPEPRRVWKAWVTFIPDVNIYLELFRDISNFIRDISNSTKYMSDWI